MPIDVKAVASSAGFVELGVAVSFLTSENNSKSSWQLLLN
jgi:hypothetical protein